MGIFKRHFNWVNTEQVTGKMIEVGLYLQRAELAIGNGRGSGCNSSANDSLQSNKIKSMRISQEIRLQKKNEKIVLSDFWLTRPSILDTAKQIPRNGD